MTPSFSPSSLQNASRVQISASWQLTMHCLSDPVIGCGWRQLPLSLLTVLGLLLRCRSGETKLRELHVHLSANFPSSESSSKHEFSPQRANFFRKNSLKQVLCSFYAILTYKWRCMLLILHYTLLLHDSKHSVKAFTMDLHVGNRPTECVDVNLRHSRICKLTSTLASVGETVCCGQLLVSQESLHSTISASALSVFITNNNGIFNVD